jgi:hypothetical protein
MKRVLAVCLALPLLAVGISRAAEEKKEIASPAVKRAVTDSPPNFPVGPPLGPPRGVRVPGNLVPPNGILRPPGGNGMPLLPAGVGPPNGQPWAGPPNGFPGPMAPMGPPNGAPRWAMPNMPRGRAELPKNLVPTLIESLKDRDKSVRQYAASALVRVGKDAVDPLLDLLKSIDKAHRANAAYVLGHMGWSVQELALAPLIKALKDEDRQVRIRAAFAIDRLVADGQNGNPMMGTAAMGMPWNPMTRGSSEPKVALPADPGTVAPADKTESTNRPAREPDRKGSEKKTDKDKDK